MSANKSVIEFPSDREMVFTRSLAAPIETVWKAWTDPEQVVLWWGPKGFTTTTEKMDVRAGGAWIYTMHGPDGKDWSNVVTYHEVKAPQRLAYDHGDDANPKWFYVTVDFSPEGQGTKLVMKMTFPTAEGCAQAKTYGIEGHNTSMVRLDAHLAGMASARHEIVLSRVFAAPRELVWQAMTDPKHVAQWWGPRGFSTTIEHLDLRVGGTWKQTLRGPDGTNYPNKSTFQEIVPLERVVYTHGGGREDGPGISFVATWTFESVGRNRTRLTMRQVFSTADMRRRVIEEFGALEGAKQTFARLGEHLPAMQMREFTLTREFVAPRQLVWDAMTDPKHLKAWFTPKGFTLPTCTMDLRPGGIFHYCMKSPDGHEMWGKWTFREIVPPEKLVVIVSFSNAQGGITRHPMSATWPLETVSTTTFVEHEGKTTLTLRWFAFNASEDEIKTFDSSHDSMRMGWGGSMDQLAAYLAKVQAP